MEIRLVDAALPDISDDCLILIEWEGDPRQDVAKSFPALHESGEATGKSLELTLLHSPSGFAAKRLLIAGAGKREKFTPAFFRKLASAALRFLKSKSIKTMTIALEEGFTGADYMAAAAEGLVVADWEPDYLKTIRSGIRTVELASIAVAEIDDSLREAFERGKVIGEACNLARNIAVEPPNLLNPLALAARAKSMASAAGLGIDILDRGRMQQLGMGSLLSVAQGSDAPPVTIVIEYKPEKPSSTHLALIGKGVTFDTGGISIKPSEGMEKMKYDMCGGAAVIGAMQAIARLKPSIAVTGIIPAVENMPGANAFRPSDIVVSLSGKTVEVLNTDAEGRLILIDAITYAKKLGATHLVDAATLTGAIAVALGPSASGVFTNDDGMLNRWMNAAKASGDVMWHMPLFDEYREQLKTVYADIQNIGTRWGGACTAAMFLKEFVEETPWVHVDIAGTAWYDDPKPYLAKGPTAVPLGTFVHLALGWG